ncbi:uncharacterized protein LOC142163951 [Nicotiana tabacum]|uniref:Uncharacterized protein LOC142163951 n=1 Tax=Nicotiana tabacum TaxID=4097 RepID=A0AC58RWW4_TOBAC
MECKFSGVIQEAGVDVRLDTQVILKRRSFKYLGSINQDESRGDEDTEMDAWKDMIKNEVIRDKVRVACVADKIGELRLRWFRHVKRRCERLAMTGPRRDRDRPKKY